MRKRTAAKDRQTRPERNLVETMMLDLYLPPDWRFQRILELLDGPLAGRPSLSDDDFVRGGRSFLAAFRVATTLPQRQELLLAYPGIYYAFQIYEGGGPGAIRSGSSSKPAFWRGWTTSRSRKPAGSLWRP